MKYKQTIPSYKICRQSTKLFAGMLKALRAHRAKTTQNWLKANMENHWSQEIWPPSSPDCNPLDLSMWSEFEREVNKQPHNTLASLRDKILEVMANMDREIVISSYKKFWSRIEAVVVASGDFIKYLCT
jgi:hypothetical protein